MEKQFNVTRRTNPDWKNKLFGRAWAALLFVSHLQSQNCGQTPDLVSARTQWSGKLADCVSVEEILDELGEKKYWITFTHSMFKCLAHPFYECLDFNNQ